MKKLGREFYDREDVLLIARELLGKLIITKFDKVVTSGRIVETEAYAGVVDRASHAYGGRRTARTMIMFGEPATAYVYLCYGIHHLFNVVTNKREIPHAILVRAVEPVKGEDMMLLRTKKKVADYTLTKGPGNVSKALGINTSHSGISLLENNCFIADDNFIANESDIIATPRIGVDYAGADSLLPYRFILKSNPYVSGKKVQSKIL